MANVVSEKCPACLAPLKFDTKSDSFKCEYCGNVYSLLDLEEYKKNNKKFELEKMSDMDGYRCSSCGAEIITLDNTASTSCVYCKNTAIIKERLTGLYAPSKIITFKFSRDDAIEAFKKKCKGRLLIPKQFSDVNNIQDMEGLYVPFWLFDCSNDTKLEANCTKVTSWSDIRYHYTKTDTYLVSRSGVLNFEQIPNDGSSRFDDKIMSAIEPFDYSEFKDFNMSYLSGFISEKYDVDNEKAFLVTTERIKNDSKKYLLDSINSYTTKTVKQNSNSIELKNTSYALLPVWVLNIKFKDKIYHFAYNGQTGKMVGEIPVDLKKFLISIIINLLIPIFVLLVIFSILGYRW